MERAGPGTPPVQDGGCPRSEELEPLRGETLILCLGNDILSDDGVGLQVASALESDPPPAAVVRRSGLSGFYLLDDLVGFERAVVVDAIRTGERPPGHVWTFSPEDLQCGAGPSPHTVGLPGVLALGRSSGLDLPRKMMIVAIEVEDMETVGENLTPAVGASVPVAASAVRAAVDDMARVAGDAHDREQR